MIEIPLTPEQFQEKSARLQQQHGITLNGPEGKIAKMGVTAGYQYLNDLLRVTILEKPFFVSTEYCETELRKFLSV